MKLNTFNDIVREQVQLSEKLLTYKGKEYAADATDTSEADRLAAFKKAAMLQGISPAQAAFGMLAKHLVSVSDMVAEPETYDINRWTEKLCDSINYLLIIKALAVEAGSTKKEADHA